jgi:hypothetical protein
MIYAAPVSTGVSHCASDLETNLDEDELRDGEKCSNDRNGKRTWIGRPRIKTPRPTSAEYPICETL